MIFMSCNCDDIHGKIIMKKYIPSHEYSYTTMQQCGKSLIPIHHTGTTDEKYILILENIDDIQIVHVKRYEYDSSKIGDEYEK